MGEQMIIALIASGSALAGALVGGLATGFTTWIQQRAETRRDLARLAAEIELRELEAVVETIGHGATNVTFGDARESIVSTYRVLAALAKDGPDSKKVRALLKDKSKLRVVTLKTPVDPQ